MKTIYKVIANPRGYRIEDYYTAKGLRQLAFPTGDVTYATISREDNSLGGIYTDIESMIADLKKGGVFDVECWWNDDEDDVFSYIVEKITIKA